MSSEAKRDDQIVTECDLEDHPGKVWRALTESELTAVWLVPEDVDCRIIAAEPERLLRCAWRSDERDGLGNLDEFERGTRPDKVDTDGDGVSDFDEVAAGTNPRANTRGLPAVILLLLEN